jgi:phosphorylated CTD-interacting factor 1
MAEAAATEASDLADKTRWRVPLVPGAPVVFDPPLSFGDVTAHLDGARMVQVTYQGQTLQLQHRHWDKLCTLYGRQYADHELLLPRVWSMLRRYQTVFGTREGVNNGGEGSGFQAAIPVPLFRALQSTLHVGLECFASPLNCYLPTYCSAFVDTDRFFGSLGSFFHLELREGSCEANPPFNEEVMDAMAARIEYLLAHPQAGALSFAVVIPAWSDPPLPAREAMLASRFLRTDAVVPALRHGYRNGLQHLVNEETEPFNATHDTHILVLQNDAGATRWPITAATLQGLVDVWLQTTAAAGGVIPGGAAGAGAGPSTTVAVADEGGVGKGVAVRGTS